jgi:predicted alpha/beta-hydrolase family hydrolase
MEKTRFFVHEPAVGQLRGVLLILWHGAGGDVDEKTIVATAKAFAEAGAIAVRARFPYRLKGKKMPDRMPVLVNDARETIAEVRRATGARDHRLVLGGRSMGGRVASMLAAEGDPVSSLVFLSYPLHPAGQPEKLRSAHLPSIACPMLFVGGDRDALCRLDLLQPILQGLGARAALHLYPGEDHSLRRVDPEAVAKRIVEWVGNRADIKNAD